MQQDALLVYGDLHDGAYDRHVVLERPGLVPLTRLPGAVLDLAPIFSS